MPSLSTCTLCVHLCIYYIKYDAGFNFLCIIYINITSFTFFSIVKSNLKYHAHMTTYPDFVLFSWGSASLIEQVRDIDLPKN